MHFQLELAVGCGLWRGTTLMTTTRFAVSSLDSSPRLWWCSVLLCALFTCVVCVWCCKLRRVVQLLSSLNDIAVLLLSFKKIACREKISYI
jgi:hypothetical protein